MAQVNQGKGTFTHNVLFVDGGIEITLSPAYRGATIALVFIHIGNDLMIEADFSSLAGIKGTVGVKDSSGKGRPSPFHGLEGRAQMVIEIERVVVMISDDACGRHHITVGVGDGQTVGGFGVFTAPVTHTFSPFLSDCVIAIQVHSRQVQFLMNALHMLLRQTRSKLPSALHLLQW